MLLVMPEWRHNSVTLQLLTKSMCACERGRVFTLDGDLGIGGGPPGLRVWLDASFPLSE